MLVDGQEWYPWVVLPSHDGQQTFALAGGTSQPFLVTMHADANTTPGMYSYEAAVMTGVLGEDQVVLTMHVNVHNFTLPAVSSRLSLWGVGERSSIAAGVELNTTQFHNFLLDHRFPVNSLYAGATNFPSMTQAELQRLWNRGQRVWEPTNHFGAGRHGALGYSTAYLEQFTREMKKAVSVALSSGWPMENMLLYAYDEPGLSQMPGLEQLSRAVKHNFPKIKIATCGDEQWAYFGGAGNATMGDGTGNGTILLPAGAGRLDYIDLIVPRAYRYSQNWTSTVGRKFMQAARKRGKKIGWYVSGVPVGRAGLNWYTEYPPMRARLMAGAAAVKQESDALLYYRIDCWSAYSNGGIRNVSATFEVRDFKYCDGASSDGEGLLILPSPEGVLSTIHFENLRDGLEDLEWWDLLSRLVTEAIVAGIDVAPETEALAVPDDLFSHVQTSKAPDNFTYSQDPTVLRTARDKLAIAILGIQKKLEAVGMQ